MNVRCSVLHLLHSSFNHVHEPLLPLPRTHRKLRQVQARMYSRVSLVHCCMHCSYVSKLFCRLPPQPPQMKTVQLLIVWSYRYRSPKPWHGPGSPGPVHFSVLFFGSVGWIRGREMERSFIYRKLCLEIK